MSVPAPVRRGAEPTRVGPRLPRVTLVTSFVRPGCEVGVIVLAADFEEMRVIGHQLRHHPRAPQRGSDGLLPEFDRTPRLPQEIPRPDQDVVARGNAGQRPGVVIGELRRPSRETIDVRCVELCTAVRREVVAVQTVEQQHHQVLRHGRRRRCGAHAGNTCSIHSRVASSITSWLLERR